MWVLTSLSLCSSQLSRALFLSPFKMLTFRGDIPEPALDREKRRTGCWCPNKQGQSLCHALDSRWMGLDRPGQGRDPAV